jgi:hypothetical protein
MFIHFFLVYFQWYPHSEFLSAGSNLCYLCLSQLKSPCWLSLTNALQRRKVMFHFWFYGVAQGVLANSRFLCLSRLSVLFAGRKRAMENFCKVKTYTHLRSLNVLPLELYVGWKEFQQHSEWAEISFLHVEGYPLAILPSKELPVLTCIIDYSRILRR